MAGVDGVSDRLVTAVESVAKGTSYWNAVLARLETIRKGENPNAIPTIVKILMPNPTIPDEDMVFANVVSFDRGLNLLIEACAFHDLMVGRMAAYFIAVWHKDRERLEVLCEAPKVAAAPLFGDLP